MVEITNQEVTRHLYHILLGFCVADLKTEAMRGLGQAFDQGQDQVAGLRVEAMRGLGGKEKVKGDMSQDGNEGLGVTIRNEQGEMMGQREKWVRDRPD